MKRLIKKALQKILNPYIRELDLASKSSYTLKVAQKNIFLRYQNWLKDNKTIPCIDDTGYRIVSQFDEDGIFVFLFAIVGIHSKTFVDIGSGDGINSNCANLAINFGWHGLFIDGSEELIKRGQKYYSSHPDTRAFPPKFVCAMVKRSNINELILNAGFKGEVDLLSIDIDGNDYWIWDSLECITPRVVCIETHIEFGFNDIVVPYDEDYVYPGLHPDYFGASPIAMAKLANRKGYRLVGSNLYGFNTIYLRNDITPEIIPGVSVEHILRHPRNAERFKLFDAVKDLPYIRQ